MNSRNKGKVGEREFALLLRENGFDARRGQQFSGGAESPDVVAPALPWLHIEVKRVQNLNLTDACVQAERDASAQSREQKGESRKKPWIVAHRRNHAPWLITMRAEFFFELVREFQPRMDTDGHGFENSSGGTPKRTGETPVLPNEFSGMEPANNNRETETNNIDGRALTSAATERQSV